MLISQKVLKIIVDDWIKSEKSLAKSCRGKFEEVPCYADAFMGTGFGYVVNTYNCTAREIQDRSIWIRRVLGEEKWIIFAQTYSLDIKPVIEIWDDRINIRLNDDNLNGWEYLRIEALYDKLKPYVLYDIPDSNMEERNSQALALGHCIIDWLDKSRPIFKHPVEMASSLKHWHIEYETDDDHVSWSNIPNFRIDITDDLLTCHHLYGRYVLHDMPDKDNEPYWVISDKPIPEYPISYFNQEKRDQMFIYIFRQHVEYILPENEQWFTGYTKNLVKSIREAINGSNVSDWCREIQMMYQQNALQYKRAEETLTTKRSELVRTSKEPETDKENKNMNELISQKKLLYIFQKWIEQFISENKDKHCFWMADGKFYWTIDGNTITAQQCTEDNGTKYWRIYQNVNFDKPCLEIFPDHIRLHDDSGYFDAFSVDSIRDLGHMIESSESKGVINLDPAWVVKEENNVRIDLKNVAVKVEHQTPNDYCIISIGRLIDHEKNKLLNMFPSAINSLRRVSGYFLCPLYQMQITVTLPDLPDFKICDSDVCNISIMDRMIISQTESSESDNIIKRNWFDSVHFNPDKEDNTMFSKEEIDIIKGFIDDIKKATENVCCDTPNATNGFTPGKVSELIKSMRDSSMILVPTVKEIMINKPATIVFWSDGSKTTSVCDDADKFDPEVGISICIAKKYLGGTENLQLEARRALTRYERREAKKLKKTKKTDTNKSNTSSKKKK